jgi:hypothetical protein
MVTKEDRDLIVTQLENTKTLYVHYLNQVKKQEIVLNELDEKFIKPLKSQNRLFGLTLMAGGLPLEAAGYRMRLEFTIKQMDNAIQKIKELEIK